MTTPSWAVELIEKKGHLLPEGDSSIRAVRKALGISEHRARLIARLLKEGDLTPPSVSDETDPEGERGPSVVSKVEKDEDEDCLAINVLGQHLIMSLEDLIEVAGVDTEKWRVARHRVNTWTTPISEKQADGTTRPTVVRNWQVRADFEPRQDREFRLPKFSEPLGRTPRPENLLTQHDCLVIGDPQFGFRRNRRGYLEPLHDRRVMDLALQIAQDEQPEIILFTGDMLDLAEMSQKFPRPVELLDTTEPSFAECRYWLASFRKACPSSRIICMEGNHDLRIEVALRGTVPAVTTLRAPNDELAALHPARLLGCAEMDVEWVGPYGASCWLWDLVEVTHGDTVRADSGATVTAEAKKVSHSKIFGHVHRVEMAYRTVHGPKGAKQVFVATPGCACRLAEGLVPAAKLKNNWQQALALIQYQEEVGQETVTMNLVHRGRIVWNGRPYEAIDHTEAIEKEIGWPMEKNWLKQNE